MRKVATLCLALLICTIMQAQIEERVEREFSTGSEPELSIKNSFGDITIRTHDAQRIEVIIEINIVPQREKDRDKVRDKIRIDINESGNRVELITINELDGINTEKMDIDYTVKVPMDTKLEIKNQFGDVWIEKTSGTLYGRVQHGDFFAGEVTGTNNSIKVQFGELRLEKISDADLEVQHGDFQVDEIADSEVEIQFSDAEIGKLSRTMEIGVQHSDLDVESVDSETIRLEMDAQFSDINFKQGDWGKFHMEMEGGFTDYSFPSYMKDMINYERDEMNTVEYRLNQSISDRRIQVDANHSDVDFY